jgi:hypothetical protein
LFITALENAIEVLPSIAIIVFFIGKFCAEYHKPNNKNVIPTIHPSDLNVK